MTLHPRTSPSSLQTLMTSIRVLVSTSVWTTFSNSSARAKGHIACSARHRKDQLRQKGPRGNENNFMILVERATLLILDYFFGDS
jgi:hypothetical protein